MNSNKLNKKNRRLILITYFLMMLIIFPLIFELIKNIYHFSADNMMVVNFIYTTLIMFLIIYWAKDILIEDFKKLKKFNFKTIGTIFGIYLVMFLINGVINMIMMKIGAVSDNQEVLNLLLNESKLFFVFSAVIFAPIVEEIVFRLAIFRSTYDKHPILAMVISSFLFGLMHVIGSKSLINYLFILTYINMGFWMAYTYRKNDNLFASIFIHFLNNGIATLIMLFLL